MRWCWRQWAESRIRLRPEEATLALINWAGEICDTRGVHIAIDGKGLRAAARKVRDEKAPYILNAIDAATRLAVGQLAFRGKANEMTAVPELLELPGTVCGINGAVRRARGRRGE